MIVMIAVVHAAAVHVVAMLVVHMGVQPAMVVMSAPVAGILEIVTGIACPAAIAAVTIDGVVEPRFGAFDFDAARICVIGKSR
jgi:hypothetical protein